ncbi:hypothetical protein GGS26DRAFT_102505 [Hypomontagnella submonticulosa]|nr:hypothetical protein GGS26DRAFT_102505 [Hypomontagnella submonticulosa]
MWERCDETRPPAGRDPDVVGLGTLFACAGSACIAVVCLVVQYLFFYLPKNEDEPQSCVANPIDVLFLGGLRKPLSYLGIRFGWLSRTPQEGRRWPAAFDRFIKALGDVQLAMGIAMLAYGYASLAEHGLSMYHWWLIVGLIWFSVLTNLATGSYLRTYFLHRDPGERWWRIILVICLVVMLSFSMIPIYQIKERLANEHDEETQRRILTTTNVLCYIPGHGTRIDAPHFRSAPTLIGIAVVIGIALLGMLKLYEMPGSVIFKWRDQYRGEMQQSFFGDGDNIVTCIRCEQRHMLLIVRPILALWLVLRLYADLLNSVLTEVLCTTATFAWVVVRFVDIVRLGGGLELDIRQWSFGQVIALVFFMAPFGALASCLCGTLGGLRLRNEPSKRFEPRRFAWFFGFLKKAQPEQPPGNDTNEQDSQSTSNRPEIATALSKKGETAIVGADQERGEGRNNSENDEDGPEREMYDVGSYKVLLSPRFVIALPLVGFSNLFYIVLLLVLPKIPGYPSTPDVLWRTIFWYIVYQPLLLFAFFLAGMIVEERVTGESRMRSAYRVIAAITALLSMAAILDTLYGLGGIPMSYIGMGTLGLVLLVYLLYGFVARPGPLAKGKGRSMYPTGTDVEEGRPLLSEPIRKVLPEVRIFPVRKQKRWHGPSRRPQLARGRTSYGTIE